MVGVVYLTLDHVLEYHDMALEVVPGLQGLGSYQSLASAVNQPRQTFGEVDLYPTVPEKAAAYGFFIAEAQAFNEGNKRTASMTMLAFLAINGYEFHQTNAEIEEMFVALGTPDSPIEKDEFFGWVCNHAKPKPEGNT